MVGLAGQPVSDSEDVFGPGALKAILAVFTLCALGLLASVVHMAWHFVHEML